MFSQCFRDLGIRKGSEGRPVVKYFAEEKFAIWTD